MPPESYRRDFRIRPRTLKCLCSNGLSAVISPGASGASRWSIPKAMLRGLCAELPLFASHVSWNDHLTVESSNTVLRSQSRLKARVTAGKNQYYGHAEFAGKSRFVCQGTGCALHCAGVRDGHSAGYPLACGRFDRIAPHLHDLRHRSRWSQHRAGSVRASFGNDGAGNFCRRSFPGFPSRRRPLYSSSACALIPRPIQSAFRNDRDPSM